MGGCLREGRTIARQLRRRQRRPSPLCQQRRCRPERQQDDVIHQKIKDLGSVAKYHSWAYASIFPPAWVSAEIISVVIIVSGILGSGEVRFHLYGCDGGVSRVFFVLF